MSKKKFTKEEVFAISKKYDSAISFFRGNQSAYNYACRHNILDEIKMYNNWRINYTSNNLALKYIENEIKKRRRSPQWNLYSENKKIEIINRLRNLREF